MQRATQQQSDIPRIGQPAHRALAAAGVQHLKQLTEFSEEEVRQWHGIGPKALGLLRNALAEKGLSFAGEKRKTRPKKTAAGVDGTAKVDEFMRKLDHPFKAEVQALREIIKGVNKEIVEEIKWNAPSFNYKGEYLVTFNLWERERIHLVFHNPEIAKVKSKLLEGDYDHRRMMYFADKKDILAKKAALEKVLKDLIKLQRKQ
jgi:uncharacterized protein YdhG (YjbR/CyaY superfamily)